MSRKPDEVDADFMQPLESLPIFLSLEGRRVVVVGNSEAAAWKADLAAASGARVDVYAERALREAPRARAPSRRCRHPCRRACSSKARLWSSGRWSAMRTRWPCARSAKAAGALLGLVDRPDMSDFSMGAIVNRSPLVIGVSTGGAAPVFAQAVRGRIETLIPASFAAWAAPRKPGGPGSRHRDWIFSRGATFGAASRDWLFRRWSASRPRADRDALAEETSAAAEGPSRGRVVLVGAGPGDPELMTLKGLRMLAGADVILFDDLVPASVLDFARREAQRINVGKRGYAPSVDQAEISALLVKLAREGKNVVRLKGGDPMIFGRANEEIAAMREAGLGVEIVPGVTAALAGAAALGVSLTNRETARRVQFVTAHSKDGALPQDFDWGALADARATTAVYMGNRTLPELSKKLIEIGADPATPAFLIERASTRSERIVSGTLADLPGKVAGEAIEGPALLLIGASLKT